MTTLVSMASLALAGIVLAAPPGRNASRQAVGAHNATAPSDLLTLVPIALSRTNDFVPRTGNMTLPYGVNTTNYVNVTLTMASHVLLETIEGLAGIDCAADSATMTFDSTESLDAAYAQWNGRGDLVLITNHLGDCDSEWERGFFVASTFAISDATLVAGVSKANVSTIASHMRASFAGLPGTSTTLVPTNGGKRDIIADPDAVSVSTTWDLPKLLLFAWDDPDMTLTAHSGSLSVAATLDGYLDYDLSSARLDALYVDVTATTSVDLELELRVAAAYTDEFSFSDGVTYALVHVPGLLTLGPALSLAVGAAVDVAAAVDVVVALGASIANATLHLDLVGNATRGAGWAPAWYANLTLSEQAAVTVTPFVAVTVDLELDILGGALDLSAGLTPRVAFPLSATLNATQRVDATAENATLSQVDAGGSCDNGVEWTSEFEFTLTAFVTQFWRVVLYSITVPIATQCYSWT